MFNAQNSIKNDGDQSEEARTAVEKQLAELHQYTRTNVTLLVQWFIFFATANYVTAGWIVTRQTEGPGGLLVHLIIALFVTVCAIAVYFCFRAQKWFKDTSARAEDLYSSMRQLGSPFLPHRVYRTVAILMTVTIAVVLAFWLVLIVQLRRSAPLPITPSVSVPPASGGNSTAGQQPAR